MRICIYGAASQTIDSKFVEDVENLGESLAKAGHSLIFGGGGTGLMGAAARGFTRGNGKVLGIIPHFFDDIEPTYENCTELIKTRTMAQRKNIMEDNSDAFLIVPGGIGTFDEFYQCLTLKQLDQLNKPIILYNAFGYYDAMHSYIQYCADQNFISKRTLGLYQVCNSIDEVMKVLG